MHLTQFFAGITLLHCSLAVKILDVVRDDPRLSALATIIAGTGGGGINPDLEQRFGLNGKNFTIFAPVNDAFTKGNPSFHKQLKLSENYPLLLSLIRSHIADGNIYLPAPGNRISGNSVEGYPIVLGVDQQGSRTIDNKYYTVNITSMRKVENGHIYTIDRVLDPFVQSFGMTIPQNKKTDALLTTPPGTPIPYATMADIVSSDPNLSTWRGIMNEVSPSFMKRLAEKPASSPKLCPPGTAKPNAILPDNAAFEYLSKEYRKSLKAPFNFATSLQLLSFGITKPTCLSWEDIVGIVRAYKGYKIYSHDSEMNMTITEPAKGSGEFFLNNAKLTFANMCAGNGCIWVVDRLIDPVYRQV
ncbi:hypothetical protein BT63DRAFT_422983 [Microthyrium microscopicum]|uniref:FAS1 domain-containing protein n=1 Tax=Microthyrium microscopicum TaxID=703497 RepID=A0A6A6UM03_9PEZI|nr:hypothetical protein BT63DRAFT_422983 [Microthyrium microscopicum]